MSDNPKQCDPTSAPSISKQPSTRSLKHFPVLSTESGGSKRPKPATVKTEKDRPRNLLPTSHRTDAANLKPDPDNPRDVLRRSTEHNAALPSFTLPVAHTSSRIVDTAGVESGLQTFHRRPFIEHRQHRKSKSTVECRAAPPGGRQERLADDATTPTFVHPLRPQIAVGIPVAAPVYRGRVAPSQSPATSETQNSSLITKDKRHSELYDRSVVVHHSSTSPITVKHEVDSHSGTPRNDASGMEQAPVSLRASDYHGATPPAHWNRSQDPLPFRAHSPIHPILIPDYGTLEERYFRILRQDETLPTPKHVETVETNPISNESGQFVRRDRKRGSTTERADESHIPSSIQSRSLRWPGASAQSPTPQRGREVATLEQNPSNHEPLHRTFQISDIRVIDSPVPNLLKSPWSKNAPSNSALTTPNCPRPRKQIRVPRQDTAAPENLASTPPETNYVTRQRAPSLRAGSAEKAFMSTDSPSSAPHTKKPASSTGSSSSSEDRQSKKQSRTSATSSSHMDFYGSFDWDVPYLPSIPTSLLLNHQYQNSVTVSPHQLHTPHHHYHHHPHVSPFSLHHQPSSIHLPFSPPPTQPVYPTSIPPHLTTLNHTQSPPLVSTPFRAEPPHAYVPLVPAPAPTPAPIPVPAPTQYGGKEKFHFAPRLLTAAENALVNSGSGSCGGASSSSSGGGDRKGKGKAFDRGSSTASNSTTGKKRKRELSEAGEEGVDGNRRTGKKRSGIDGEEDGGGEEDKSKNPSSPTTDKKKSGRKRNNKIDIACNHCRSRKLKCDGLRPVCSNCTKRFSSSSTEKPNTEGPCRFDAAPRRRGPAKHKQLKLDTESEPSWPPLRAVPRTRARAAAEAMILTQPPLVDAAASAGAGTSRSRASTGGSEASIASDAHLSTMSILFGGERVNREAFGAVPAAEESSAASSTREGTPADEVEVKADENENDEAEEIQAGGDPEGEGEEKKEEDAQKPRVKDEEREVKPIEEDVKPKKKKLPKKMAKLETEDEEGKGRIVMQKGEPESPSSLHYLFGRHSTSYPSTSTHRGYVRGHVATTNSTRHSPPAVVQAATATATATTTAATAGLSPHIESGSGHEEEQGEVSDEEAECSDDDYDSQGEESE